MRRDVSKQSAAKEDRATDEWDGSPARYVAVKLRATIGSRPCDSHLYAPAPDDDVDDAAVSRDSGTSWWRSVTLPSEDVPQCRNCALDRRDALAAGVDGGASNAGDAVADACGAIGISVTHRFFHAELFFLSFRTSPFRSQTRMDGSVSHAMGDNGPSASAGSASTAPDSPQIEAKTVPVASGDGATETEAAMAGFMGADGGAHPHTQPRSTELEAAMAGLMSALAGAGPNVGSGQTQARTTQGDAAMAGLMGVLAGAAPNVGTQARTTQGEAAMPGLMGVLAGAVPNVSSGHVAGALRLFQALSQQTPPPQPNLASANVAPTAPTLGVPRVSASTRANRVTAVRVSPAPAWRHDGTSAWPRSPVRTMSPGRRISNLDNNTEEAESDPEQKDAAASGTSSESGDDDPLVAEALRESLNAINSSSARPDGNAANRHRAAPAAASTAAESKTNARRDEMKAQAHSTHERMGEAKADSFGEWRHGKRLQNWRDRANPCILQFRGLFVLLYTFADGTYELCTSCFEQPTVGWSRQGLRNAPATPLDVLCAAMSCSRAAESKQPPDDFEPSLEARVLRGTGKLDVTVTTYLAGRRDRTFHWLLDCADRVEALESRVIWEGEYRFRKACLADASPHRIAHMRLPHSLDPEAEHGMPAPRRVPVRQTADPEAELLAPRHLPQRHSPDPEAELLGPRRLPVRHNPDPELELLAPRRLPVRMGRGERGYTLYHGARETASPPPAVPPVVGPPVPDFASLYDEVPALTQISHPAPPPALATYAPTIPSDPWQAPIPAARQLTTGLQHVQQVTFQPRRTVHGPVRSLQSQRAVSSSSSTLRPRLFTAPQPSLAQQPRQDVFSSYALPTYESPSDSDL